MVDSIAWHAVNGCQGLMFFASGFDRVSEGGSYEIHYEARKKMGRVPALVPVLFVVLQRLPSTPQSQAKQLWIAAGFVLCFLWVYDFSNAMRAPQCRELHCLEMFRVCMQNLI